MQVVSVQLFLCCSHVASRPVSSLDLNLTVQLLFVRSNLSCFHLLLLLVHLLVYSVVLRSLFGVFLSSRHLLRLLTHMICVQLVSENAIVIIQESIFEVLGLLSPHVESLRRNLLLQSIILLGFEGLVSLWTTNFVLKLGIGHIVDGVSLLHVGKLLLVAVAYGTNGRSCSFLACHRFELLLLSLVLH